MSGLVLVIGDPIEGITIYGPFPDADGHSANEWAELYHPNETWWTVRLEDPNDELPRIVDGGSDQDDGAPAVDDSAFPHRNYG